MAFPFLDEENIYDLYDEAVEHHKKLIKPFPEYARIAANKPSSKIPKRFPKNTDGTTAAIIEKSPRRVVQQAPSGKVVTEDESSVWPVLADFAYRTKILPNANAEYDLLQKQWITLEKGQTFGSQPIYTPLLYKDGEMLPDFLTPHYGNVFQQPGKKSGYDCKYSFLRTWWQKEDVEQIICEEKERIAEAKQQKLKYEPLWDLEALESIKGAIKEQDEETKTQSDEELSLDPSGIEIVTGFQEGEDNVFYTFNPDLKVIVRRISNPDLRKDKMPLDWYYYDIDGSNPLGRSLINLIGPLQNLIDSDMQAYSYNRALALQPPLNVFGNVNTRRISMAPNAVNKITDVNARIDPFEVNTSAIRDYPNIYGLQISQLMKNTNGDPATAISSEVGDPQAGKTPTAIKARNAATSSDDNAMRKSYEAMFENWSETAINLYFGANTGIHEWQLDSETADKVREILSIENPKNEGVELANDNIVKVDFDAITTPFQFRIDASTSKVNSEAEQLEALNALVQTLDSSPSLSSLVPIKVKAEVWNAIASNSGVDGSEKLKITPEQVEEMIMSQNAIGEETPESGDIEDPMPEDAEMLGDIPVDEAPLEEGLHIPSEDEQIANELRGLGAGEDVILEVQTMIEKGYGPDEIIEALKVAVTPSGGEI